MKNDTANAEAIEAWNTFLFDKFLRFRPYVVGGLEIHGHAALDRHPPQPGAHVLDLGCGFGDTTTDIAGRVGPRGEAVGVDAAARFIDLAANEARDAQISNVRFEVVDVESEPLGGPYDYVFSRFGVMFFANPVAAMRNVRRSMKSGARLVMAVWRKKEENPWLYDSEQRVLAIVPHPEKTEDQITCGPGPFSMAGPDLVSAQLKAAGFRRISFERFDADIRMASNIDEALDIAMALGPAGEIMRLAGDEAEAKRTQVTAALKDMFKSMQREDGIYGASSSWIVSAIAP
jgi:ubiquinone/menaquinone biosynthesis C-methylase UbiE